MKLKHYLIQILDSLPKTVKSIEFEIYLDAMGNVSTGNTGNKITFTVIRKLLDSEDVEEMKKK